MLKRLFYKSSEMLLISFIQGEFFYNKANLEFHLKTTKAFGVIANKVTKSCFSLHTKNLNPIS